MRFFPIPSIPMTLLLALVLASLLMTAALAGCGGGEDPGAPVAPSSDQATPSAPSSGSPAPGQSTPVTTTVTAQATRTAGGGSAGTGSPVPPTVDPTRSTAGTAPTAEPAVPAPASSPAIPATPEASPTPVRGSLETDREALIALFNALNGRFWESGYTATWATDAPLDQWPGVFVEDGRVVRLALESDRIKGVIPPEVGSLSALRGFAITEERADRRDPPGVGQSPSVGIYHYCGKTNSAERYRRHWAACPT